MYNFIFTTFGYSWWPISHWSPEWVGAIGTIVTIYYTIRYYNKDRKVRFLLMLTPDYSTKQDGIIVEGNKIQTIRLDGFNDSLTPAMFMYVGYYLRPNLMLDFIIMRLNVFVENVSMPERIRDWCIKLRDKITPGSIQEVKDIFSTDKYITVKSFERIPTVEISFRDIIGGVNSLLKIDNRNRKRLLKGKKVKIEFVFQKHDGTKYRTALMVDKECLERNK
ncbi:hypothetical protein GA840_04120 [Pediococcus ethanolidurans]|uniref:hypothetical protein n=1 Tax=Pediococcus ethanolidurans TaxID=319653 RepID=UPI002953FEE1|nr:hypothetical protein [Pediococcus ethanolidurans]MDV7719034.1 hypothetical protein [Pediococcus ethanolidurans]